MYCIAATGNIAGGKTAGCGVRDAGTLIADCGLRIADLEKRMREAKPPFDIRYWTFCGSRLMNFHTGVRVSKLSASRP
jgi:hypothetical protein